MKNSILILVICLYCQAASTQSTAGVEQYYYLKSGENTSIVPMAHYRFNNKWYGEARYNYDDDQTFSLYAGKTFSRKSGFSYSATPMLGGLIGRMNGGSVGLNMDMDFENIFFSTQSQYSFSMEQRTNQFFLSWSELGYQATSWFYGGLAMQQTNLYKTAAALETGYMIGFNIKNWTVPVYVFSPSSRKAYFVLGINWEWENVKKNSRKFNPVMATNTGEEAKP
jgi:hypothetical protein